jgi:putative ABC transport system ATP-binding protein
VAASTGDLDQNFFRFVWRFSRRDQLAILAVVLLSLPLYFLSLDLPKTIVNEAIQGRAFAGGRETAVFLSLSLPLPAFLGGPLKLFDGIPLPRVEYLMALSLLFLALVLVNGGFKYVINTEKGLLGERMLRRLRYNLFGRAMGATPEAAQQMRAAEIATMIKDEVEPIGGFIGDAFIQPVFLLGMALTAFTFIILQNLWLGLMTAAVISIQFLVIPRLRREQLRLGKERQLASRKLAGRVAETVDALPALRHHEVRAFEQADIGQRLGKLFEIRLALFRRKFAVKFLNNLIAQVTPFLFYAGGGYLAIRGDLDIGQLIAVIAAYRDLPPPIKELIDWDQQRQDVEIKYQTVVSQFALEQGRLPADEGAGPPAGPAALFVRGLSLKDQRGGMLLDGVSLEVPAGRRVALVGGPRDGADTLAAVLAGRLSVPPGRVGIGGLDRASGDPLALAGSLAFVSGEPIIMTGSVRDNVVLGLRRKRRKLVPNSETGRRRLVEAVRTGDAGDDPAGDWIDYALAGASGPDDLDDRVLAALAVAGLGDEIWRMGLQGRIDPAKRPELAGQVVAARRRMREILAASGKARLIEPFDPERYTLNATVAENILFGTPVDGAFREAGLAEDVFLRRVIIEAGLEEKLAGMGLEIASTMIEIFEGLESGHPLFERFSFISADEIPLFGQIVQRRRGSEPDAGRSDTTRLIGLALRYVEPRHRLGLVTADTQEALLGARRLFREKLPAGLAGKVAFHEAESVSAAAPLSDNILFGRIAFGVSAGAEQAQEMIRQATAALSLDRELSRLGLDQEVGAGGRLLSPTQRVQLELARVLVKRPAALVMGDMAGVVSLADGRPSLAGIVEALDGATLVAVIRPEQAESLPPGLFGIIIRCDNGRIIAGGGSTS